MDENERIKQSIKNLSFTERIRHIWYYYKWFIVVGLIVTGFLLVCMVQCSNKKEPDAVLMYAGPQPVSSNYYQYINSALSLVMQEDYNGDGYKTADILELTLATEKAETATQVAIQTMQHQTTNRERFYIERTTGPSIIYLIDKKIYPSMTDHLVPLTDALGYLPENAIDEYGIPLSQLECYKKTDMKYLPSDAILCIRLQRVGTIQDDSDKDYSNSMNFFKDIVEWKYTEETTND